MSDVKHAVENMIGNKTNINYWFDFFTRESFKPTIKVDDEDTFIVDWRGAFDYVTRYLLDKKTGTILVSYDAGPQVFIWNNSLKTEELKYLLADVNYVKSKSLKGLEIDNNKLYSAIVGLRMALSMLGY